MPSRTYAVVEKAGYVGEWEACAGLPSYSAADTWMRARYEEDEIASLHVAIAADLADGSRTYEV